MKYLYLSLLFLAIAIPGCTDDILKDKQTSNAINVENNKSSSNKAKLNKIEEIDILICEPDYQPINYCNNKYKNLINKEAQLSPNFDDNKRIVTIKVEMKGAKINEQSSASKIFERYFIVIDLDLKTATPLTEVLTGFISKEGYLADIAPIIKFNKNSDHICYTGSLVAYRNAYPNITNACYTYNSDEGATTPLNEPFEQLDINTLEIKKLEEINSSTLDPIVLSDTDIKSQSSSIAHHITDIPLTLDSYTSCYSEHSKDYCLERFPILDIEHLPSSLKKDYRDIDLIDTVFKLPSIGNIDVYLLSRTNTDVEEYTLITFKNHIIDNLLIGKIGSEDDSDRSFLLESNYSPIEITEKIEKKLYKINDNGEIVLLETEIVKQSPKKTITPKSTN